MMTIKRTEVTVGEITRGYVNNDELGVRGYDGRLDIRPPYQREFIYSEKEQQAVINTVLHGYPLNVMYWVKRSDDAECPYEVMDGQQRTLSLCEYVDGKFSIDFKNFFNQPEDIQKKILDYPLTIYVCEVEPSEKLERWPLLLDELIRKLSALSFVVSRKFVVQDHQHSRQAVERAGNQQRHLCRAFRQRCQAALLQVQLRCLPTGKRLGERHPYPSGLPEESIGMDG